MKDDEPGIRLARIQRKEKLESGGKGEVWSAVCEELGDVVVKLFKLEAVGAAAALDAEAALFLQSFEKALTILPDLRTLGLPKVFDGGVLGHAAFLVMEHLRGKSLRDLLLDDDGHKELDVEGEKKDVDARLASSRFLLNQRLAEVEVLRAGRDLYNALAVLEEHGLLHGDLQRQHFFMGDDGGWTLLGAGMRPIKPQRVRDPKHLELMAPERLRGQKATAQSDVFSVGVVLFRLLNGRFPFVEQNALKLITKILKEDLEPFQVEVDFRLKQLIVAVLAKDSQQRPTAHVLSLHFAALLSEKLEENEDAHALLDVPHEIEWCVEQLEQRNYTALVERLRSRPELAAQRALTSALWSEYADVLLRPLYEGQFVPRALGHLLALLPHSLPDLIAVAADLENLESTRVAACRLLALAKERAVLPYLVPLLNESFAWLQRAAWAAIVEVDADLPIGFSLQTHDLFLFTDDLGECRPVGSQKAGNLRLHHAGLNADVLPAHACLDFAHQREGGDESVGHSKSGFFAAPAPLSDVKMSCENKESQDWSLLNSSVPTESSLFFLSEVGSFELKPFCSLKVGAGAECDLKLAGLEHEHALFEHVGDGRLSIRLICKRLDDKQKLEVVLESGEADSAVLEGTGGQLELFTSLTDPRIMLQSRGGKSLELPVGATRYVGSFDFNETFTDSETGLLSKFRGLLRKKK